MKRAFLFLMIFGLFAAAHAMPSVIVLDEYLPRVDAIIVGSVTSIEEKHQRGERCGNIITLDVSEKLYGNPELAEIGSADDDLKVGQTYVFFLEQSDGYYFIDGDSNPWIGQGGHDSQSNCLGALPTYLSERRLTGRLSLTSDGEFRMLLNAISDAATLPREETPHLVSISEQVILPDSLEKMLIEYEVQSISVDNELVSYHEAAKLVSASDLFRRGRYLPWRDYRHFLLEQLEAKQSE